MAKLFVLGISLVALTIAIYYIVRPRYNPAVSDAVFVQLVPGMSVHGAAELLGTPTRTSRGDPKKLVGSAETRVLLYENASGKHQLSFYVGAGGEEIVVASLGEKVVATEYVVGGSSVYYNGPDTNDELEIVSYYRPPSDRARAIGERIRLVMQTEHRPKPGGSAAASSDTGMSPAPVGVAMPDRPPPDLSALADELGLVRVKLVRLTDWLREAVASFEENWQLLRPGADLSKWAQLHDAVASWSRYHAAAAGLLFQVPCPIDGFAAKRQDAGLPAAEMDPWIDFARACDVWQRKLADAPACDDKTSLAVKYAAMLDEAAAAVQPLIDNQLSLRIEIGETLAERQRAGREAAAPQR